MPFVKFKADFSYIPADEPRITIPYSKGALVNVTTPCAKKALDLGLAVKASKPKKTETTD